MAVSDEDVKRLLEGFELYNAGQYDAIIDWVAPDFVMDRDGGLPPLRGREELRRFWEPDAFEWQRFEPQSVEVRGDKVLMTVVIRSKGAGSSIELEFTGWMVWTADDGLVTHLLVTRDEPSAREHFES